MSEDDDEPRKSGVPLWVGILIGLLLSIPLIVAAGAMVMVVLIVALSVLGNNLSSQFNYIGSSIGNQPVTITTVEPLEVKLEAPEEEAPEEGQDEAAPNPPEEADSNER
jgi:Flp pilus assembly pilin Flp